MSWPAPELCPLAPSYHPVCDQWNSPQHTNSLASLVDDLKLSSSLEVHQTGSWRDTGEQVLHHLAMASTPGQDCSRAGAAISSLLARAYRAHQRRGGEVGGPPPSLLPWVEVLMVLVQHRLEGVLGGQEEEVVVWRREVLGRWEPPQGWRAGLGWGAEHLETTVRETLENSRLEASGGEVETPPSNMELARALRREQKQSRKWEEILERAVAGEEGLVVGGRCGEEGECQELEHDLEEVPEDVPRPEFVPVISYISPSLGHLVSPLTALTRYSDTSN